MSYDLFGNTTNTVEVPFNNGVVVTLRQYITAGIQEDIEAEATKLHRKAIQDEDKNKDAMDQSPDDDDEEEETIVSIHMSKLKQLQKMLVKIEGPGFRRPMLAPFGMKTVRGFSREAFIKLTDIIEENNPPVNQVRERMQAENQDREPEPPMPVTPTYAAHSPVSEMSGEAT